MKTKGFTLIEVLIVIAVFSLIAAIVVPVLQKRSGSPVAGDVLFKAEKSVVFPEATGYVVDTIGLLDNETKAAIEEKCKAFDEKIQLAVCIVNTTSPLSIEDYAIKLAEKWQVGHRDKDNGVILLLAKEDRKVRIEVGRGLESKLPDSKAGDIINNVITPYFKAGNFNKGFLMGVNYILTEATNE